MKRLSLPQKIFNSSAQHLVRFSVITSHPLECSISELVSSSQGHNTDNKNENETVVDVNVGTESEEKALHKAVRRISASTGMPSEAVRTDLLKRLSEDRVCRTTPARRVRFFKEADDSYYTDCPNCDGHNEPGWTVCSHCRGQA